MPILNEWLSISYNELEVKKDVKMFSDYQLKIADDYDFPIGNVK